MILEATEFIRRFPLHVLPSGFVRIRQFGFLANRARGKKLALCRALLGAVPQTKPTVPDNRSKVEEQDDKRCPVCKIGRMVLIGIVPNRRAFFPLRPPSAAAVKSAWPASGAVGFRLFSRTDA